jgi:hypothetical protein
VMIAVTAECLCCDRMHSAVIPPRISSAESASLGGGGQKAKQVPDVPSWEVLCRHLLVDRVNRKVET